MDSIWNSVLDEIETQVSRPVFLTFLKTAKLASLVDSVATISTQTDIGAEYTQKRYYALIKKVFDKRTGKSINLVFKSEEKHYTPSF